MTNLYGYLVKHFWQNVMNRPLRTKLLLLVSLKACIFSLILSLSFLANGHEWQGFCTLIISLIYGAHFSIILSDHSPAFQPKEEMTRLSLGENLHHRAQEKDYLLQLVSHEIRAPLMHFSHALDKIRGRHPHDKTIKAAQLHSSRMLRITNQLLDFQASKHRKPGGEYIELLSFFDRLEAYFEGLCPHKTVRFERTGPMPQGIYSQISNDNLEKVCINYLSNALKYTPEGGDVVLEIKCNQDNILVQVRDQGPGIASEQQHRLFKMFSRLDHHNRGSGIGLALVLDIISKHHGCVGVDSRLGEGATFWFMLPATTTAPPSGFQSQLEDQHSAILKGIPSVPSPMTEASADDIHLWVVDDDPFVHDIWLEKYEHKSVKIRCFYNPDEMKSFIRKNPEAIHNLSFIITDFHFGDQTIMEFDWRDALKRASFKGKIILSSHMEPKKDDRDHFDAVIGKIPLGIHELSDAAS